GGAAGCRRRLMTRTTMESRTCAASKTPGTRVTACLKPALDPLVVEPTTARATFTDENGPKGGPAIRCTLEAKQPRRPAVHVEAVATTQLLAFDRALAKLERAVARPRQTPPDAEPRPQKDFPPPPRLAASLR